MAPADDYIRCLPSDEDSDDEEEEEEADNTNDAAATNAVESDADATNADDAPDTENAENYDAAAAAAAIHADSDDSESDDSDSDSDDSEDSDDDEYLGYYHEYCYRKFMKQQLKDRETNESVPEWLHCVDIRGLGDTHDSFPTIRSQWTHLLTPEELNALSSQGENNPSQLPQWYINPEQTELESLQKEGLLQKRKDDGDSSSSSSSSSGNTATSTRSSSGSSSEEEVGDKDGTEEEAGDKEGAEDECRIGRALPCFEGFFGQNTCIVYYDLHIQLAYAPFLAKCVQSLDNCHEFFLGMFFGGTIPDALGRLKLTDDTKGFFHVRSPLQKIGDSYYERDMSELETKFPFFPLTAFLKAKGSNPSRTWSSQLYHDLMNASSTNSIFSKWAEASRSWAVENIKECMDDFKGTDLDGGQWFQAYLRKAHPDIYNDIDVSDEIALTNKEHVPSLSKWGKKYNVGEIKIPTAQEGFDAILQEANTSNEEQGGSSIGAISPKSEIMAKLIVDNYMYTVVDFCTVLKMGQIISRAAADPKTKRVVLVCYMGSCHTREMEEFLCDSMGFQRKDFFGKLDWDSLEARKVHVPSHMWHVDGLFPKTKA
uniref:Uncharacterized protein n=1 Tax=Attheya septentrionalis TaxID=420275 RepID=A0A7S2XKA7_9STRA